LRALICAAEASVARDPVQGWRDVAIVRVLADAGLRCEELLGLERRDFLPKRKGAKLRALRIRHGKGNRRRRGGARPCLPGLGTELMSGPTPALRQ
jgi:site-specific recombinase XerC